MFFLYSIWGLFYVLLSHSHDFIERNFLIKNNPFLIRRRTFKFISYFEKLFLVLFYKKNWFDKSIANLFRKKDVIDYRKNYYPIINSFHTNYNKVDYDFGNLKLLSKQYNYYKKNKLFKKKFNKILNFCFSKKNKDFIKFLSIQELNINSFYNYVSYNYYNNVFNNNLIKFNKLFSIFILRSTKKLIIFDLDKWNDWYNFNFNKNIYKYLNIKVKLTKQQKKKILNFKKARMFIWINTVFKYKQKINKFNKFFSNTFKGIIYFRFNYKTFFKITVNRSFSKILKYYIIKFSESSVTKHINSANLKNYSLQYLRKNRIFNKGRYSRNRQLYRTGVYWCLWLNIIMVYGLYFIFYRFTFNFGYFWWGILVLAYSTIFSRISKYNFYNPKYILMEIRSLVKWVGYLVSNFILLTEDLLKKYFLDINLYNYIANYKINSLSFFYDNYYFYFIKYFKKMIDDRKRIKIGYFWQGMKEKDNSFLRYKTVLHWIKEIYRAMITK